jgi:hypothetical protein
MAKLPIFSNKVQVIICFMLLSCARVCAQALIIPEVPEYLTSQIKQKLEVQRAQLLLKKEWVDAEIAASNSNRTGKQLKDSLLMIHEYEEEKTIVQKDRKAFENEIATFGKLIEEQSCILPQNEGQSANPVISLVAK